jgi:hypothetical protein
VQVVVVLHAVCRGGSKFYISSLAGSAGGKAAGFG